MMAKSRTSMLKRERLIKKASHSFLKDGYERTTFKNLAKAVGIQGPGVYHYFDSKEDLLLHILERADLKFQENITDQLKKIDNPEEKVKTLIQNIIRLLSESGEIPLIFDNTLLKKFPQKVKEKREKEKQAYYFIRETLKDLIESRNIKNHIDLNVAAFSLIGMSVWVYKWFNPKGRISIGELSDQMIDLFFNGFLSGQYISRHSPKKGGVNGLRRYVMKKQRLIDLRSKEKREKFEEALKFRSVDYFE